MGNTYRVKIKIKRSKARSTTLTGFYHDNSPEGMSLKDIKEDIVKRWQKVINDDTRMYGCWVELEEVVRSDVSFFLLARE